MIEDVGQAAAALPPRLAKELREHGLEARPRQMTVAAASCELLPPDLHDLMVVPPDPLAIPSDAVVGAVPPDHLRQTCMLLPERTVQVLPAPFSHGGQRTRAPILRRCLAIDVLALPRLSPHVGEAEEVERGPERRRVPPSRASKPKSTKRVLVGWSVSPYRLSRFPSTSSIRFPDRWSSKTITVIGVADQLAPPFQPRSHHRLEPSIQHVVQIDV